MAYVDEDGKIMIDEDAAMKDVRRLREAKAILQESYDAMGHMAAQAAGFQGNTNAAISEKGMEMVGRIRKMMEKLEEAADFIEKTVAHYRKLDAELKAAINSVANAADSIVGGLGAYDDIKGILKG